MNNKAVLALLKGLIDKRFEECELQISQNQALRGKRGRSGTPGKDFDFEENKEEIYSLISSIVDQNKDSLKLNFANLTASEKEELTLKFEDITPDQMKLIQGPKGERGREGQSFNYDMHKAEIYADIQKIFSESKESLKLKLSDLSEEELGLIRGSRGQRGKRGEDFNYEEHHSSICNDLSVIVNEQRDFLKLKFSDLIDEEKEQLKLKFSDLTEEEIQSLEGSRGQRGKQGKRGLDGRRGLQGLQGVEGPRGIQGIIGKSGPMGVRGIDGLDGKDGLSAPIVIDVEVETSGKGKFRLIFHYSDGTKIETGDIVLPISQMITSLNTVSGGGGGGSITAYEDSVEIGEVKGLDFNSANFNLTYNASTKILEISVVGVDAARMVETYVYDEDIAVGKCVYNTSTTNVAIGSSLTEAKATIRGIALDAKTAGQSGRILLGAKMVDAVFSFTGVNKPLFCAQNGDVTETVPTLGAGDVWECELGETMGATAGFFNIANPREL